MQLPSVVVMGLSSLLGWAGQDHELPPDFAVERVSDRAGSFIALAFDPSGRAIVSVEEGGLLWFADDDGDGAFESSGSFSEAIAGVQGMCWLGDQMYASGIVEGRSGLWRVGVRPDGLAADSFELLAEVRPTGATSQEHGAHAVVPGPDGGLYWVLGDHVELVGQPDASHPTARGYAGSVLPVLPDPLGQAAEVRYPAGHVVRVDPTTGSWWVHSTGLRNAYDLAFDGDGELFTFDSDMEWDVGLPWYRPVRFLHLVPGGEYGWRRGSSPWPAHRLDSLPPLLELGRGSPTGLVACSGAGLPPRYDGAILAGDWTHGRILALFPEARGASFSGRVETLVQAAEGLSITDLAFGPDGHLYFVGGGRGTLGRLERLVYRGPLPTPEQRRLGRPQRAGTWLARAREPADLEARVSELESLDPVLRRRACEALACAPSLPAEATEELCRRLDDTDRWVRFAARRALQRHAAICARDPQSLTVGASESALVGLFAPAGGAPPPISDLGPDHTDAEWLAALRVFGLYLLERPEALSTEERELAGVALLASFPHPSPDVARAQASLVTRLQVPGALEALAEELALDQDFAQRIHYARCLAALAEGWTPELARPVLVFLEQALTRTGGASYPGYLERMHADVSAHFSPAQRVDLARDVRGPAPLGPRTLVAWMRAGDVETVDQLVGPLQYAWGRMAGRHAAEQLGPERASVLAALPATRAPRLAEFLRRQCDNPEAPRAAALTALARLAFEEDFPRFLEGLSQAEPAAREGCARALLTIERAPASAAPYRLVLSLAERFGEGRGKLFLELFSHWAAETANVATPPAAWNAALRHWERWAVERFPGFATEVDDSRRPAWEFDDLLRFLERSAQREGSAARGAEVFAHASCTTCHVVGGSGGSDAGWGPELTGVTRRFELRSLLEAIVFPSLAISDQHGTVLVQTRRGAVYEGRLLEDNEVGVILLEREGTRRSIARAEVADLRPSELSSMPEGLLTGLTLEQIKDLLAFLEADGEVESSPGAAWVPLFDAEHRNLWEGDSSLWKLRGGGLVGRSRGLQESAYLVSKRVWRDFELEFDVRLENGVGNSGVQYRARTFAGDPDGYQADIGAQYWGSLYAGDGRGTLAGADAELWREVVQRAGWNHFHLRVAGDRHTLEVNGERLVDHRDAAFAEGLLAFQLHAGKAMEVRFQNARLRPLR